MTQKPMEKDTLLLDAGNAVVFLDHQAVAEVVGAKGTVIQGAERAAKDRYAMLLHQGGSHEDGWRLFMRTLLDTAEIPGAGTAEREQQLDALRTTHDRLNLWRRVPPGLPEALTRVREAGWVIGIVSNSEGHLPELFDAVGLGDAFDVIVDSTHVGVRKPDPRIFEIALEALGRKAEQAAYAGDIPDVDMVGARAAGIDGYLIDPHGDFPTYAGPKFDQVIELVDALLAPK